eukprot:CAMPEP_0117667306 /NCGR_PEP_ID=MMETSP0804-20121206/10883_1 /TAXON_ID=1074897 /ORGANISM="Tetraselmis astigmatica, Strain CCMP880" /LENGTH=479 /DNA_ID=CAMNT_0005474997 /DNA_START=312 /DNA_END=1749 /DNA_ORIENTATION=-
MDGKRVHPGQSPGPVKPKPASRDSAKREASAQKRAAAPTKAGHPEKPPPPRRPAPPPASGKPGSRTPGTGSPAHPSRTQSPRHGVRPLPRENSRSGASRESSRPSSREQGKSTASGAAASVHGGKGSVDLQDGATFSESVQKQLATLLDRPEPSGVDWGVQEEEQEPPELTDAEVAKLLEEERASKPSQTLTQELIAAQWMPGVSGELVPSLKGLRALERITHLRLDRQRISRVQPGVLEGLPRLTNLYLQHNRLTAIPELSRVSTLRFLVLSHNQIQQVSSLSELPNLMFLDLSCNKIRELRISMLPPSLRFLEVDGNPCMDGQAGDDLVIELMAALPNLKRVDGMEVSQPERAAAQQVFYGDVRAEESNTGASGSDGSDDDIGDRDEESRQSPMETAVPSQAHPGRVEPTTAEQLDAATAQQVQGPEGSGGREAAAAGASPAQHREHEGVPGQPPHHEAQNHGADGAPTLRRRPPPS